MFLERNPSTSLRNILVFLNVYGDWQNRLGARSRWPSSCYLLFKGIFVVLLLLLFWVFSWGGKNTYLITLRFISLKCLPVLCPSHVFSSSFVLSAVLFFFSSFFLPSFSLMFYPIFSMALYQSQPTDLICNNRMRKLSSTALYYRSLIGDISKVDPAVGEVVRGI